MKYIAFLLPVVLFMLLAAVHTASAQENRRGQDADTEVLPGQRNSEQENTDRRKKNIQFVDENGDGINDNLGSNAQRGDGDGNGTHLRERRRDHFIDNDGDGINDNRCNGMGIMHGKRRGQQKGGRK